MEAFLFPPNSLLSIDLPGIFPLSHIPPFQTSLKKIFFTNPNHISQSAPFPSTKRLQKEKKKENQHFCKASWVQGQMTFCMPFCYTTIHPLKTIFFVDVLPFLKVAQRQNMSSYALLPDTKYRSRLTVHVQ